MSNSRAEQQLALHGSMKAVTQIEGKGEPKIGIEEFMSVAERFGFSTKTLDAIRKAVEKEDLGGGPFLGNYYSGLKESKVQAFERVARAVFGVKYAIGVSSGTAALHSAFVAAGVGPGTEVICPAIGFYATAAAVVTAKGVPVFCDVDDSLSIDPKKIESRITNRTVAIAPTHVMGTVCDMGAIMRIARKHKLRVVEDCAQSCGGTFKGKRIGTFGDLGCFSISCYKIVGGGEGGLIVTNDKRLWERANQVAECGGLWRPDRFAPPRYDNEIFCGTNYRMSELEAAVDVVQLKRMPATVKRSNAVKMRILRELKTFKEIVPQKLNDPAGDVGYLLRFYPETIELGAKIVEALRAEGVSCGMRGRSDTPDWHIYSYMFPITMQAGPHGPECVYTCKHYTDVGGKVTYARGDCPVADDLFDRVISVNLNQWHTPRDCRNIAKGINKVLAAYCTPDSNAAKWL
ncbi:MAG TPA: DegT/DnrJ/EryC1/StrS family aminotransferase [Candidatus Hydrogenedentes bacterium]|nr:DegT/DnrJ/EryC1/StrS family aminotransferase [Candidatus Hydrogenedentota bacterium]HPC16401.1 DegT/DnrJ/EryC1/StrS family aminotransferase [Candidatus Hydrogenedentota bacterium]HRT20334.1 DegT/DnrJ/EryC1/StrS family aminotransferase [Candidatus Hydrogenedentota bacterium]HRT65060.1 DegT/DnrJ/EryC1/StrS family aminotransferase [Candidatus Hydrogenedentota bacterium]